MKISVTSLSELQREANCIKQKIALKTAFTTLTNVDSWDEAMDKFPHFATDDHLDRFINVDIRKNIPKTFTDFCQRAKNCTSGNLQSNTMASTIVIKGSSASVLISEITEVNGSLLRTVDPSFQGAHLIITSSQDDRIQ